MADTREKLIELLRVPIYPHELADPAEVVADYLLDNGLIFATDNNVGHNWIPVTERFPTFEELEAIAESDKCLVVVRRYNLFDIDKYKDVVREASWTGDYFSDGSSGWGCGRLINVTHWMPLPEPPKEGEQ